MSTSEGHTDLKASQIDAVSGILFVNANQGTKQSLDLAIQSLKQLFILFDSSLAGGLNKSFANGDLVICDYFFLVTSNNVKSQSLTGRRYSHATYWNGKRKRMSELDALVEVVDWLWDVYEKLDADPAEKIFR